MRIQKHSMKKWIVEKKPFMRLKIAHEAGKYDKYDEKELEKKWICWKSLCKKRSFCSTVI